MNNPQIFLSHNWRDKDFVRRLAADLQSAGADVWTDEAEIKVGDSLIEKVREGIDKVDYLAVVLSSHSVESEWVKKEVDIAMNQEIENRKVKVLPILLDQCNLPGFLKGKLYADFTTEEKYKIGLSQLINKLELTDQKSIYARQSYGYFSFTLLEECLENIEPFTKEEWDRACSMNFCRDEYATGNWLLGKLTPTDPIFWYSKSVTTCHRIELLIKIIKEMGRMSLRAEGIRDELIKQIDDIFDYDPEYDDWVQRRKSTLYKALETIGDTTSLAALKKRWPNGI